MKSNTDIRLLGRLVPLAAAAMLIAASRPILAGDAATPSGGPVIESPTLQCLGAYWIIRGDDNRNAKVEVSYRKTGDNNWRPGPPLFRVEKGANRPERGESRLTVPPDAWLFAGSVLMLAPDTEYELKLQLSDPDGGQVDRTLKARTLAEPVQPAGMRELHVVPGDGGGTGTAADPFRGLAAAEARARPGDLFLVHSGRYHGTFEIARSGRPDRPIIWRGLVNSEGVPLGPAAHAVIDAQKHWADVVERAISASDTHDVWFEDLIVANARWGLVIHASQRIVVRRCQFQNVNSGITGRRNTDGKAGWHFIADNVLGGTHKWSDARHGADVEEHRGIELSGTGNVVCFNRVAGFKDGIDMAPSAACVASDVHNNEVSECLDDGCEMDGSDRNCRCFNNRFTNVFQGISIQPIYGGPVYVCRNALYNVQVEAFKMHNSPSGGLFIHNTVVKNGIPLTLQTNAKVRNCVCRNNLFVGTTADYAFECSPPMQDCDFDYDGFAGGPWGKFLKWNNVRYDALADVRARAPVYRHAVRVDPANLFANGILPPTDSRKQFNAAANDLRPKAGSAAVDAGQPLSGFNDDFRGKAPDLGAYELGSDLPHYGPRPAK